MTRRSPIAPMKELKIRAIVGNAVLVLASVLMISFIFQGHLRKCMGYPHAHGETNKRAARNTICLYRISVEPKNKH